MANRKVKYIGVFVILLSLLAIGCQSADKGSNKANELCGFLKSIDETSITIDEVEYITPKNSQRMKELNLTEKDLLSGYYIYNLEEKTKEYLLTSDTVYNFIDWGRNFTDSDDPEKVNISTTDINDFIQYINTYTNSQPNMPFFFEIDGENVVSITEKPMAQAISGSYTVPDGQEKSEKHSTDSQIFYIEVVNIRYGSNKLRDIQGCKTMSRTRNISVSKIERKEWINNGL